MAKRPEVHEARKFIRELLRDEDERAFRVFIVALDRGLEPGTERYLQALRFWNEVIREQRKRPR